jgi:hypothetical protein
MIVMIEHTRLLSPCLNQNILKLLVKALGPIRLRVRKEQTHYSEMSDKIFDIDMNAWSIAQMSRANFIQAISWIE